MVYLQLFHGRLDPDQDMTDWGTSGPTLGPFRYLHFTYGSNIKFELGDDTEFESMFSHHGDLIYYDGVYYGDCSIVSADNLKSEPEQLDREKLTMPEPATTAPHVVAFSLSVRFLGRVEPFLIKMADKVWVIGYDDFVNQHLLRKVDEWAQLHVPRLVRDKIINHDDDVKAKAGEDPDGEITLTVSTDGAWPPTDAEIAAAQLAAVIKQCAENTAVLDQLQEHMFGKNTRLAATKVATVAADPDDWKPGDSVVVTALPTDSFHDFCGTITRCWSRTHAFVRDQEGMVYTVGYDQLSCE